MFLPLTTGASVSLGGVRASFTSAMGVVALVDVVDGAAHSV